MKHILRSRPALPAVLVCVLSLVPAQPARADTLQLVDALRTRDCPRALSDAPPLQATEALDAVASEVLEGHDIRDALQRSGYRATRSAAIRLKGEIDDASLESMLRKRHCAALTDPELSAIGIARKKNALAIVLAAPFAPPAIEEAARISAEVLELVNAARGSARRCGAARFAAAPPLAWNEKLEAAAAIHAGDMAAQGSASHEGSDHSKPADRVTRVGYVWAAVAENVAVGHLTARDVVDGWLASSGHCANIMDPDFLHVGVAYAANAVQANGIYWAQVFAAPRP